MVTLPSDFVAIHYPGYFWNIRQQRLYTMKVTGVLRPLVKPKPNIFNDFKDDYRLSVNGQTRYVSMNYLKTLQHKNSVIPVAQ